MKVQALAHFICPLDGAPLKRTESGVCCGTGHNFDRAREGYINLLPVQHKASRDPGDDQAMIAARRRTLDDGLFTPLADAVFETVRAYARVRAGERPLRLVDAGCGEGYYLAHLHHRAQHCDDAVSLELAGYDISKWAVRAAARRNQAIAWVVASNRQPPVPPASIDLVLSLFGFPHWTSFEAILVPGGRVLTVDAGPRHLLELRKVIYPQLTPSDAPLPSEALERGWRVLSERCIEFTVPQSTPDQSQALIAMTPHAHRISANGRAALVALHSLDVTMSMVMRELVVPERESAG